MTTILSSSRFLASVCLVVYGGLFAVPLSGLAQENSLLDEGTSNLQTETETQSDVNAILSERPEAATTDERTLPPSYRIQALEGDVVYGDFVVGPGKVELEIAPGSSKTVMLSVSNRTGADKLFEILVEDAEGSTDPNTPIVLLGDDVGPYTIKDLIQIDDTSFVIGHNQKVQIPVTVSLPTNAEPGGRYGSVLVTTTSVGSTEASTAPSTAIVSRIGTIFFVTTPGLENREGSLTTFSTSPQKKWYRTGPINFGLLFSNTGSVHLNPYGEIRINNTFGTEVGIIEIDPWFAMPESVRLREVQFDREWMFGRYTATASINRGYNNEIDTATYSFWVINWVLVVGIFAGMLLLTFSVRSIFKHFEFRRKI